MYTIGRKWHRIETVGRKPLSKPEPYIGCSALYEEEGIHVKPPNYTKFLSLKKVAVGRTDY